MAQEIVIRPPGRDTPGFLRRWRRSMELQERIKSGDWQALDEMVNFMLETAEEVVTPAGVDARDALLDLSRAEFDALVGAMRGDDEVVDPQSDD